MIHENLELHNVAEVEPWAGWGMGALHRTPRAVANTLGSRARWIALGSAGSEIRFVTDAQTCHLYIGSLKGAFGAPHTAADVLVYRGDHRHDHILLQPGVPACIELNTPPGFDGVPPHLRQGRRFSSNVWRVCFECDQPALHHLDVHGYAVRPPTAAEKPALRWLAYGSSITNGATATRHVNCHVQQTAWRLGVDVINLGMSGACSMEPEMADWIASRDDWDFATFELGINMLGWCEPDEFRQRATHLLETVRARNPAKPIALITHFLCDVHFGPGDAPKRVKADAFDSILRELAGTCDLSLIEGQKILTDAGGLTTDLVHPADHGMIQMGENLAAALAPFCQPEH